VELPLAEVEAPNHQGKHADEAEVALLLSVFLGVLTQLLTQSLLRDASLLLLLLADFHEGKNEYGGNVEGMAFQPLQIPLGHHISVVTAPTLDQPVAGSEQDLSLVGALRWSDVVGAAAVHQQGCWDFGEVVNLVGEVRAHCVADEEAEEGAVDCVEEVVGGEVGALAVGVEQAFEVEGQREVLPTVVDEGGGVAALEVGRLVELLRLADEVSPLLLQDQLPDGLAHLLALQQHRLQRGRPANRTTREGVGVG
jgi:hypothetical protein